MPSVSFLREAPKGTVPLAIFEHFPTWAPECIEVFVCCTCNGQPNNTQNHTLCTLSADSSGQLDVFRHNCHALGVNRAEVGILEETDEVCFAGLLQNTKNTSQEASPKTMFTSHVYDHVSSFPSRSANWVSTRK